MRNKLRVYIGGALACLGVLLVFGAAGSSDQGTDFADTVIRVAVGGGFAVAGMAIGY